MSVPLRRSSPLVQLTQLLICLSHTSIFFSTFFTVSFINFPPLSPPLLLLSFCCSSLRLFPSSVALCCFVFSCTFSATSFSTPPTHSWHTHTHTHALTHAYSVPLIQGYGYPLDCTPQVPTHTHTGVVHALVCVCVSAGGTSFLCSHQMKSTPSNWDAVRKAKLLALLAATIKIQWNMAVIAPRGFAANWDTTFCTAENDLWDWLLLGFCRALCSHFLFCLVDKVFDTLRKVLTKDVMDRNRKHYAIWWQFWIPQKTSYCLTT